MASQQKMLEAQTGFLNDDGTWDILYQTLRPSVRYWVYRHIVPSWLGQEEDIINDIIQETLFRTWKHLQKVQVGAAPEIASLPHFCRTIATNYATDLQRRERRECRLVDVENIPIGCIIIYETIEDVATNRLCQEELYILIAEEIKCFPQKQREVLLTDLAQHTDFNGPITHLERTFLQNGICLANYQEPPQQDAAARNRYWSLLSIAYKRLRITLQLREDRDSQECKNKQRDLKIVETMHTISHSSHENTETFMFSPISPSQRVKTTSFEYSLQTKQSNTPDAYRKELTNMETSQPPFLQNSNVNTYPITQDPDVEHIQNDPELALLALHLRQSSPNVVIDPVFRATLRGKIQAIVQSGQPCSSATLPSSQKSSKDVTLENEEVFSYIAHNIVKLPETEQKAVLIDLAKQIRSDTDKRSFQKALSDLGIQLEEYQGLPQFDNYMVIYAYKLLKGFLLPEKRDNIMKNIYHMRLG